METICRNFFEEARTESPHSKEDNNWTLQFDHHFDFALPRSIRSKNCKGASKTSNNNPKPLSSTKRQHAFPLSEIV
jgi:hypothetical protein